MTSTTPDYATTTFAERFGAFCKLKRENMGMKQVTVAELAFGSKEDQKNLTKIETGKRKYLRAETIKALREVLDIQDWEVSILQAGHPPDKVIAWGKSNAPAPSRIESLNSRSAFIGRATSLLSQSVSFRAQLTGPFFCHPSTYFQAKTIDIQYPDLDKAINEKMNSLASRSNSTRIILSNSERYAKKVKDRIPRNQRRTFFESCLENVDLIWGADSDKGPDLCCAKLGYFHIPYIFDNSVLIQHRRDQMSPTEGGDYISEQSIVEIERNRFDSVFDNTSEGQRREVEKLRSFFLKNIKEADDNA